ncbi:MAG: hypothetical protein V1794_01795 [Candidatus Glassbacteria bacterium]
MATWKDGAIDRLGDLGARISGLRAEIEELDAQIRPLKRQKFEKGELLEKLNVRAASLQNIVDEES